MAAEDASPVPRRFRLTVAYDGSRFHGWQLQEGVPTVQGALEDAVLKALLRPARVEGASRTDAGVHALGQAAAFSASTPIPTAKLALVLNAKLPPDVRVLDAREAPADFDPRRAAVAKHYCYTYYLASVANVFLERVAVRLRRPVDSEAMNAAAGVLVGEHDFRAFQNASEPRPTSTVRRLYHLGVRRDGALVHIDVVGSSFLFNMVRILAGSLVEVGLGRRPPDWVSAVLAGGDRRQAGPTAASKGLCLRRVFFEAEALESALDALRRPWHEQRPGPEAFLFPD